MLSKALWEEAYHLLFGATVGRHDTNSVEFRVIAITIAVLMKHPKIKISGKEEGGFKWDDDVTKSIMAEYLRVHKKPCARSVKDFETKFGDVYGYTITKGYLCYILVS